MYVAQPHNYEALVTPYAQRLLQFGIDDSKIYLSKSVNAVFRAFTNGFLPEETERSYDNRKHAILDGGYVTSTLDGTSLIKVTLSPSTIIADNVLMVFPEATTVDVDVAELDPDGELLVFLSFKYNETVYENKPLIKVLHYDENLFTPNDFQSDRDTIILQRIKFEITDGAVTKITCSILDPYIQTYKQFLTINGDDYEVAPLASLWYRIIKGYHEIHARRQEFILDVIDKWILDTPTFDIGINDTFYSATLNIDVIHRKNCLVQCYINDIKIDPTAIQHIDDLHVKIWMPAYWVNQDPFNIMMVIVTG